MKLKPFAILLLAIFLSGCPSPTNDGDTTPPGDVSLLFPILGDGEIELYINYPSDSDFDHIEIWYGTGNADTKFTGTIGSSGCGIFDPDDPHYNSVTTISGLTNNTQYNFKVITVDASGNKSSGATMSATPVLDNTAPSITITPTPGSSDVSTSLAKVTFDFSEPMLQGPRSFKSDVPFGDGGDWVDEDTYEFNVSETLTANEQYTIIINPSNHFPGFFDLSGNPVTVDSTYYFTTAP